MSEYVLVESFRLDHTKVRAPYVRLAGVKMTPKGDRIEKYDLRLGQPNQEILPPQAIHTLEHLLAGYLRSHIDGVIDLSPMGCRTGFYAVMLGEIGPERMLEAFRASLEDVVAFEGEVPGASALECGNYRDHDLASAKDWARRVLEKGLIVQETVQIEPR
ncbi:MULTISPECIES: S-ribosylhomocysteine lyase [unclassified Meiothermus]|uniref:S-ribosylhomocysteine lyase n=1 Tax=unclassified Meiothermus TaxID=370471 RepID=UPI000D7CA58B|nr:MULTISPECIES: S-ribosylhomocysteine lyase [unclassified Meiothermus]PZA08954.1 S-ribosylhomocysteine lyase [Meiothermus sp. Pnk-1]RYM33682.1 S-ribosylhomocysteine lyase [Meiothermus sp. PNK-Is4]